MFRRSLMFLALIAACGDPSSIELIVADERLPFLESGIDFNALGVEARADNCANTMVQYPPQALPASLAVLPGDCFKSSLALQAFALFDDRRIAQSSWLELSFPEEGIFVATATLSRLPGRQTRFRTGFEPGEPIGGAGDQLFIVQRVGVDSVRARADATVAAEGMRSIELAGTATSTGSHILVRAVATDLLIMPGDRLSYALLIEEGTARPAVGVDLVLDSGQTAAELGLVDGEGIPIHPVYQADRIRGTFQRYYVDLSPAAGSRLVGVLLGFDARNGGSAGTFTVRMDDLFVESAGL